MTLEQCLAAATEIENKMLIPRGAIIERSEKGRSLSHLRWMVTQMREFGSADPAKAQRWLGFIQGALVWGQYVNLEKMKDLNRSHADE